MKKLLLCFGITASSCFVQAQTQTLMIGTGVDNYDASGTAVSSARLSGPWGLGVDPRNNNVYISNTNISLIVMLTGGKYYPRCGNPQANGYKDGTGFGTATELDAPHNMAIAANGDIFFCDNNNFAIRKLTPYRGLSYSQTVSTLAGGSKTTHADGTGTAAGFVDPEGIVWDKDSNLIVAEEASYCIRKVTRAGVCTTIAGDISNSGHTDGNALSGATFEGPGNLFMDSNNDLYIQDGGGTTAASIRKLSGGKVTTITKQMTSTSGGIVKGPSGKFYYADGCVIREWNPATGDIKVFAGDSSKCGTYKDGSGTKATMGSIANMILYKTGGKSYLMVSHTDVHRVSLISIPDTTSTGVAEEIILGEPLDVYPNPANQSVNIVYYPKSAGALNVYDATGREIENINFSGSLSSETVDTRSWKNGIYLLRLSNSDGVYTSRMMVNH